jgi:hypothetical protein
VKLIEDGWKSYARDVLPKNASEIQITETRRAFYAGAISCFYGLASRLDANAGPLTRRELAIADDLSAEIDDWVARMVRGEV